MGDNRGCFRWVLLALACIAIVLLLEIFGYAHKTYERITGGEQYSEIGVITQKAEERIEEWKGRQSSGLTMDARAVSE